MAEDNPHEDLLALASRIAPKMAIVEVNLMQAKMLREGYIPQEEEVNLHSEFSFKNEYHYQRENRQLLSIVHFRSVGKFFKNDESYKVYRVEASFAVSYMYQGDDDVPESTIAAFAAANGIYNCWPYWREFLQANTVRMALPAVVLPLITGAAIQDMLTKGESSEGARVESNDSGEKTKESERS